MSYFVWLFMMEEDKQHLLIHEDASTGTQWRLIENDHPCLSMVARLDSEDDANELAGELDDGLEDTCRSPDLFTHVVTREPMDFFMTEDDRKDAPAIRWVIESGRELNIVSHIDGIVSDMDFDLEKYPAITAYGLEMGYI